MLISGKTSSAFKRAVGGNDRKFVVNLTTRCNLCCPHCLRRRQDKNKRIKKDLSPLLLNNVLTEGRKLLDCRRVNFTGGEPILHPRFDEILKSAKELGYDYSFVSNGFLFENYWRAIKKINYRPAFVLFSLDGVSAETHDKIRVRNGSFARVIRAIRFFRRKGVDLGVNFCLNKKNYFQIEDFVFLCQRLGIKTVRFIGLIPFGNNLAALSGAEKDEAVSKIAGIKKKPKIDMDIQVLASLQMPYPASPFYCSVLSGNSLAIDPRGRMLVCCDIYENIIGYPSICKVGFSAAASMALNAAEELKKQRTRDLAQKNFFEGFNDCRYCNKYLPAIMKKIAKGQGR